MNNTYKILFDLQVTHTYFKSGFSEGLIYQPCESTSQLMTRYAIKILNTDRGFQLYLGEKDSISTFLKYVTKTTGSSYFEFNIRSQDQVFYQYTDLPLNDLKSLLFDSEQSYVDEDFIVLKQQFQDHTNNLFKIRVHFEDILNPGAHNNTAQFRIDFFSRTTKWQYIIINSSERHFDKLSIKGDAGVKFDEGTEVLLSNGQAAIAFNSIGKDIAFSQVPRYNFDLISIVNDPEEGKRTTVIFKELPMPNPSQLQMLDSNTESNVVSPVYLYI